MEDLILICKECRHEFVWTARDQEFYAEKHFPPPKRCKLCRQNKERMYGLKKGLQELSINNSRLAQKVIR